MFEFLRKKKKKSFERQAVELNQLLKFLGIDEGSNSDRLSEVTYFTCLKVLGEGLAKLPLALQRVTEDGGIVDMVSSPLWQTVKIRPNPYMSPSTFWTVMENNRNHWGNSYAFIDRDDKRGNVRLWPLDPTCIRIEYEDGKDLSELTDIIYVYTSPNSGKTIRIPSENILHFKTSTVFAGLIGLSVREKLALSLDGAVMSQKMLNRLYKNNFIPKAAVQFDVGAMVNEDYETAYLKTLQDYADGKGEGGSSFIPLSPGTTIVPLNIRLTDGQFLELRKYTALQIAAAFGIKPNHLNDYEKSSYANSEAQQLAFYTDTMLYILKQYEEELNFKLLSQEQRNDGFRYKFNIAAVLRGDTKSQLESLSMGVSNGVYTPNEARRNLDLPALPGGDRLYFNGSNIPIDMAGIQYQNSENKSFSGLEKAAEGGIIYSIKKPVFGDGHRIIDNVPDGNGGSSGGGSGGTAASGSSSGNIKITDEAIGKVPKPDIFGDEEKNKRYQQANKDLLKEAQKHPVGTEVSIIYDENMNPIKDHGYVVGEKLGQVRIDDHDKPYHAFHNHPSGETFSPDDLLRLTERNNQLSITAIGNNSKNYCMMKTEKADSASYNAFLTIRTNTQIFGGGRYSYNDIKNFEFSMLPDLFGKEIANELGGFVKECISGGEQYGFKYIER